MKGKQRKQKNRRNKRTIQQKRKRNKRTKVRVNRKKSKNRNKSRQKSKRKNKLKSGNLFRKFKKKGKDTIQSFKKWTKLPAKISKDSKCEFCGHIGDFEYFSSGDITSFFSRNIITYYRCGNCKTISF